MRATSGSPSPFGRGIPGPRPRDNVQGASEWVEPFLRAYSAGAFRIAFGWISQSRIGAAT